MLIKSTNGDDSHYELQLDNQDRGTETSCDYPTYLDQDGNTYALDVLVLNNRACIRLDPDSSVRIHPNYYRREGIGLHVFKMAAC